jgi:hypothetical protein
MSPLPRPGAAGSRSHRVIVLCLIDWLHAAAAEIGLAPACDDSMALKVARTLHRVFLTYIFLGSLEGGHPGVGGLSNTPGG